MGITIPKASSNPKIVFFTWKVETLKVETLKGLLPRRPWKKAFKAPKKPVSITKTFFHKSPEEGSLKKNKKKLQFVLCKILGFKWKKGIFKVLFWKKAFNATGLF